MFARGCPLSLVVLVVICCTGDTRIEEREPPLLLAADSSETAVLAEIGQRQRALLRALTDAAADPTPYMTAQFTMVDRGADPNEPGRSRRDLLGRARVGWDRWQTLAKRLPPEYAAIEQMEVTLQAPARALVVVRHGGVGPTVTHWYEFDDAWKASWLTLNMPEEVIAEMSRRAREELAADASRRPRRGS